MIYQVKVTDDSLTFELTGLRLVSAPSGEVAAKFALDNVQNDYPDTKHLRVSFVREIDGEYIGEAT